MKDAACGLTLRTSGWWFLVAAGAVDLSKDSPLRLNPPAHCRLSPLPPPLIPLLSLWSKLQPGAWHTDPCTLTHATNCPLSLFTALCVGWGVCVLEGGDK